MTMDLYHLQYCPYSKRVRDFIASKGLESIIVYHDVGKDRDAMKVLRDLTGKTQVPCLVIDGKPLLESEKIVSFLEDHVVDGGRVPADAL